MKDYTRDYAKPECKRLEPLSKAEHQLICFIRNRMNRSIYPVRLEVTVTRETFTWQQEKKGIDLA